MITYALWDKVDQQYLSWKHPTYKSTMGHLLGYFNHRAAAILKIDGTKVVGEMRKDSSRLFGESKINFELAQKRYLPMK